jgi:hypothetical protein
MSAPASERFTVSMVLAETMTLPGGALSADRTADGWALPLLVRAARPELDQGQDADGHQQPRREQDVHGEAEDNQGHDGDKEKGDKQKHGDQSPFRTGPLTLADPASAVVAFMLQGCRRRRPPSIGISPGSHPGMHP